MSTQESATPPVPAQNGFVAGVAAIRRFFHSPLRTFQSPIDAPSVTYGRLEWMIPLAVVIIATLTRFVALDEPHTLVFDETYYVKQGWSIVHLGYEGTWPEDANDKFAAGDINTYQTSGERVVHPPLGKWVIGLGMLLFGGQSSFSWRFATALLGVGTVLITYLIARRLTQSAVWAGLAGLFVAVDGMSITMSRVSLLDGVLTFFVMLGVLFLVYDHRSTMARIATAQDRFIGPVMWNRPWVVAAGLALGAACAVKWSGISLLAGYGIYLVVTDAFARKHAGIKMWGASAIGHQAPASFVLLVVPAAIVYIASWTGWMTTTGGYERNTSDNPFVALWNYHSSSLGFHVGLDSEHPYASPAWQWPFMIRPTAMYWNKPNDDTAEAITGIANPLLWWAAWIAVIALIVLFIFVVRDWRFAIILVGLAMSYVPWLAFPNRTIFFFYTVLLVPFLMIGLVLLLQTLTSPPWRSHHTTNRAWRMFTIVFTALALLVSAYFMPMWTGAPTPYWYWLSHIWFETWS